MTYRKLVTAVAAEFVEDIKASEMGSYRSFRDFARDNYEDATEIKEEINYTATQILNNEYQYYADKFGEDDYWRHYTTCTVNDDCSISSYEENLDVDYRKFKSDIISEINSQLV